MDTIYYTLNTRRVKVSGGADLLTFVPTPAPAGAEGGEVLDFDRCRQKLETKAAWKALAEAAQTVSPGEENREAELVSPPLPRRARQEGLLDAAASIAVIGAAMAAMTAFLQLV